MQRLIVATVVSCVAITAGARPAFASAQPRTTNSGLPEHWAIDDLVVVLDPSLEQLGDGATETVEAAMTTWTTDVAGLPHITFERSAAPIGSKLDGKSVVSAGVIDVPGHEEDLAITTSYAEDTTGALVEADILFNVRYVFATETAAPCHQIYDVGAVATHETGHFFGLGEDYTDDTTTMFVTTFPCDEHKRVLTTSDESSVSTLYASVTAPVATAQCDVARGPRPASRAWLVALVLGTAALARRGLRIARRRRS